MGFEFVNNNATIDRASRRRIRSHAAKGKNVGRKLVRPSKIKAFGRKSQSATAFKHNPEDEEGKEVKEAHHLEGSQSVIRQIERQVGDGLFDHFSLQQTPEYRSVFLKSMFTYRETGIHTPTACRRS
jgi:hypothetical protein